MDAETAVLVGYDGSGRADVALRWAISEAQARGLLSLRIVTVVPFVADDGSRRAEDRHWSVAAADDVVRRGQLLPRPSSAREPTP